MRPASPCSAQFCASKPGTVLNSRSLLATNKYQLSGLCVGRDPKIVVSNCFSARLHLPADRAIGMLALVTIRDRLYIGETVLRFSLVVRTFEPLKP